MIVCDRCRKPLETPEIYDRYKIIEIMDLCLVCRDNLKELLTEWLKGERKDA